MGTTLDADAVLDSLTALEKDVKKKAEASQSVAETYGLCLMAEGVRWARQELERMADKVDAGDHGDDT